MRDRRVDGVFGDVALDARVVIVAFLLLEAAALALASVSGYFSILGLAAIFAAVFWPPMSDQNGANAKVINLMDALRRSVEASGAGRPSAKSKGRQPATQRRQSEQPKRNKGKACKLTVVFHTSSARLTEGDDHGLLAHHGTTGSRNR